MYVIAKPVDGGVEEIPTTESVIFSDDIQETTSLPVRDDSLNELERVTATICSYKI